MPVEPPPTVWEFPDPREVPDDLVAVGADLSPGTVLAAYRHGLFPMHADRRRRHLGWWSPDPRGILPLDGMIVSRSLRRSRARLRTTVDRDFHGVITACQTLRRPGAWITDEFVATYTTLHELGWAHSVETWDDGELVGGLYGIGIGGFFAGESMFHRRTDASKVALARLVDELAPAGPAALLDVQWVTPHLASLGAVAVGRTAYLELLGTALASPGPPLWTDGVTGAAAAPAGPGTTGNENGASEDFKTGQDSR